MAEVINLNRARKARARDAAAAEAGRNRVKFGRTKAEKAVGKAKAELEGKALDGHRREPEKD